MRTVEASMGPHSSEQGNHGLLPRWQDNQEAQLQWGLTLPSKETRGSGYDRNALVIASMGPHSSEQGNGSTARTSVSIQTLQWGLTLPSKETQQTRKGIPMTSQLQWGLTLPSKETRIQCQVLVITPKTLQWGLTLPSKETANDVKVAFVKWEPLQWGLTLPSKETRVYRQVRG